MPQTDAPTEVDFAWAAGFLDGEGSFIGYKGGWQPRAGGARVRTMYRPRLSAAQATHREPIDRLRLILGGSVHELTRRTSTGRPVFEWALNNAEVLRAVLPRLVPHMTVKRAQAEALLEFAQLMRRDSGPMRIPDVEILARAELANRLHTLKAA